MRFLIALVFMVVVFLCESPTMAAEMGQAAGSDQAELVRDNIAFAIDLYGQLKSQPGNLFFSPESISAALAMTYAGARGETATEMATVLHFTLPQEKLHPAMGALLRDLNTAHDGYQLKVANALWGQHDYTFLDGFAKYAKDNYDTGVNQLDFRTATEAARVTINSWVEQQTENKVKDLIPHGVLTRDTRLVLTNAIYFKGDWETKFKEEDTKDEVFYASSRQTMQAPLMHRTGEFYYFDGGSFQALEVPYRNKDLSMIVFLPKDTDGVAAFEQSLTADSIQQWLGQLRPVSQVIVSIPKFKMEKQFGLRDTLAAMGMKQSFETDADYSGMDGKRDLSISAVIHKACVDVNEEGTEAAAATTGIITAIKALRSTTLHPINFRADHSFLFLIRDSKSGGILFMGRVIDPTN